MPPFDPRREPVRFAPTLTVMAVAVCAAGMTMAARSEPATAKAKPVVESTQTGKGKADKAQASKTGAKAEAKSATAKGKSKAAEASSAKTPAGKTSKTAKTSEKASDAKTAKAELAKTGKAVSGAKTAKADNTKTADAKTAKDEKAKAADIKTAKADKTKPPGTKAAGTKTAKADAAKPDPVKVAAKSSKTAKTSGPEPKYGAAQTIKVRLHKGETLEAAIRRAEASPAEAKAAAAHVQKALGKAPGAGQLFAVEVAPREGRVGAGRLMGLTLKSAALADPVVLGRSKTGELTLSERTKLALAKAEAKSSRKAPVIDAEDEDEASEETATVQRAKLITGEVRGSLFGSARKAGVGSGQIGEIIKAFAAKVDFQRDLKAGDKFTVVYDDDGKLLYAKIKSRGSYRFARNGGEVLWLDDDGKSLKHGLLRTPVDGARMSSRFGLRIHPILGYAKMHQGIDFAAATGTPIMAAGDGVVVEARRWGGYGNWLRIKHAGGYESGYAHLSRYASGLQVGDKVHQGQLVAYVGSTGASTGPHLHHEIWHNGKRVDPRGARIPTGFALEGQELVAFKAQQAKVQAALERSNTKMAGGKRRTKVAGLRPSKDADIEA